jgi:methionine-rich copper-binding protein CopC
MMLVPAASGSLSEMRSGWPSAGAAQSMTAIQKETRIAFLMRSPAKLIAVLAVVAIGAVAVRDQPGRVADFAQKRALPFKVALDASGEISRQFGNIRVARPERSRRLRRRAPVDPRGTKSAPSHQ